MDSDYRVGSLSKHEELCLFLQSIAGREKFDDSWMGDVVFLLQHDATTEEIILYDCCFLTVAVDRSSFG